VRLPLSTVGFRDYPIQCYPVGSSFIHKLVLPLNLYQPKPQFLASSAVDAS
jgi:hypothetical protein